MKTEWLEFINMSRKKAFTLIEVVLAIAMLTTISATFLPIMSWLNLRSRMFQYDSQAGLVLQKSMEVAYNVMISNWDKTWSKYPEGIYHPGIEVSADKSAWVLIPGEETNVEAKFSRTIEITPVCRNPNNGDLAVGLPCMGINVIDNNSKMINSTVVWKEAGNEKTIKAKLLVTYLGN
jgi:type II secretory pathway pseudopilin PulG